jgi:hypothetical protein
MACDVAELVHFSQRGVAAAQVFVVEDFFLS